MKLPWLIRCHMAAFRFFGGWPLEVLYDNMKQVRLGGIDESAIRKADWEGYVRFGGGRYSVPPEIAGKSVIVAHRDQKIVIRCGEMIVAEHAVAARKGTTVADPEHLAAMWTLTLGKTENEIMPRWHVRFDAPVATASLAAFDEVVA